MPPAGRRAPEWRTADRGGITTPVHLSRDACGCGTRCIAPRRCPADTDIQDTARAALCGARSSPPLADPSRLAVRISGTPHIHSERAGEPSPATRGGACGRSICRLALPYLRMKHGQAPPLEPTCPKSVSVPARRKEETPHTHAKAESCPPLINALSLPSGDQTQKQPQLLLKNKRGGMRQLHSTPLHYSTSDSRFLWTISGYCCRMRFASSSAMPCRRCTHVMS